MKTRVKNLLNKLGVKISLEHGDIDVHTPVDGSVIASIKATTPQQQEDAILKAKRAFLKWRDVPAPVRGEVVRTFGNILRENKEELAGLVAIESGKIMEEALGEVQEMIDVCDFATGLSRQLYGLTIQSERPQHVMAENWYPLGIVSIISTFNFPVAVWAWNTSLALVCGDTVIWKPSEKTPLSALASQQLLLEALKSCGQYQEGISSVVIGEKDLGKSLVADRRIALVSATGSVPMGKAVAPVVAGRFGKLLLELGGNNAAIVTPSADLDVAMPSILFGAVGTAGQRCTTTRRLFVHQSIYDHLFEKLLNAYKSIEQRIGSPLDPHALIGPLIDRGSYKNMQTTLSIIKKQGGEVFGGQRVLESEYPDAYYVTPALARMKEQTEIAYKETFAPILYVIPYSTLEEAIEMHNAVPQGLSSTIFTTDLREAEYFRQRSDCGIANVNIGTSGAEIGGAFGGEKETGGGRESGSDAWKNYMRRQTTTTYFGSEKPKLAQGISFDTD